MYKRNPTLGKRWSGFERRLTVSTIFGVLSCIILSVSIDVVAANPEFMEVYRIQASHIENGMNSSMNPCDDFYQFACGRYTNNARYLGTQRVAFTELDLQHKLKKMMEINMKPNELKPFRLIKNLYNSCIHKDAIHYQEEDYLRNIFKKLGGWPVLDGEMWNETNFDWAESIYKSRDVGYTNNYFMSITIGPDLTNSSKRVIYFDKPPSRAEQFLNVLDDRYRDFQHLFMVNIAVYLGAEKKRASNEFRETMIFLAHLMSLSLEAGYEKPEPRIPMTLDELSIRYPRIPWLNLVTEFLGKTITVEKNETVVVITPSFFAALQELLSTTPKRVQANYVMWKIMNYSLRYLNPRYHGIGNGIVHDKINGTAEQFRWVSCIAEVSKTLPLGVGSMYVRKYFSKKNKEDVVEIAMNIAQQFDYLLQKAEWMDPRSRNRTLEKLRSMTYRIAYDDDLLNDTKLEEFYENLELSGGMYLESILNVTAFHTKFMVSQFHTPIHKNDWAYEMGAPGDHNIGYSTSQNALQISAGFFQYIVFSTTGPQYVNYAAIGSLIGREIAHGFTNDGLRYNKNGQLVKWWKTSTKKKFNQRIKCLRVDGHDTVDENIADNIGIKIAYLAYNHWARSNGLELKLPFRIPYTPRQMFWLKAAAMHCERLTPHYLKHRRIEDHPHSNEARVNRMVSNMRDFSTDFNCTVGSRMNPPEKCSIW